MVSHVLLLVLAVNVKMLAFSSYLEQSAVTMTRSFHRSDVCCRKKKSRSVMMIAVAGSVQISRYCLWGVVDCSGISRVVFPADDGCDNGGDGRGWMIRWWHIGHFSQATGAIFSSAGMVIGKQASATLESKPTDCNADRRVPSCSYSGRENMLISSSMGNDIHVVVTRIFSSDWI